MSINTDYLLYSDVWFISSDATKLFIFLLCRMDKNGRVNMCPPAVSRLSNLSQDQVLSAVKELENCYEGPAVKFDGHMIFDVINHGLYRMPKREYNRIKKRESRDRKKLAQEAKR